MYTRGLMLSLSVVVWWAAPQSVLPTEVQACHTKAHTPTTHPYVGTGHAHLAHKHMHTHT